MPLYVSRWLVLMVFASALLSAATVDPVQGIIDDMTLPPDAALHGTEALDWGTGAAGTPTPVPNKNYKGEWFEAMTNWGQVYIPRAGSTATNTRCQIRNLTSKLLRKNGTWETVQSGGPQGGAFREDFRNNEATNPDTRDESTNGGGLSMIVGVGQWAGYNYHFWNTGSRAVVDITNTVAVFTSCEARLIISNPNLQDDRASCKNLLQMGGDWWLNQGGGWLPDWSANSGICSGRAKWVTSEWQTFSMCTLAPTQIRANPPVTSGNVNQAPTVTLTSPNGGTTFTSGATITLQATAADVDGSVVKVEFLVDGTKVGEALNAPYSLTWTATDGNHTLTARAIDNLGLTTVSSAVSISVASTPVNHPQGPAGYTWCADEGQANSPPFNHLVDVAYGANGLWTYHYAVTGTILFDNSHFVDPIQGAFKAGFFRDAVNQPPTVTLTAPTNGASVVAGMNLLLTASANDSDGSVTSVDFLNGATLIGSDTNGADGWSFTASAITAGAYQFSAVAKDNSGAQATSATVNITVTTPVVTVPSLVASVIGTTTAGTMTNLGDSITVSGSGRDIWGTSDGFEFAARALAGDGQIVARVASQSVTDPWAKAGLMMRNSLSANASFVFVAVTPGNGIAFQRRLTTGASSSHTGGAMVQAPYWLKLVRLGNRFTAFQSLDGVTWLQIGAVSATMSSSIQIGLAVTSHHDGAISTAVFDHITITGMGAAGG